MVIQYLMGADFQFYKIKRALVVVVIVVWPYECI